MGERFLCAFLALKSEDELYEVYVCGKREMVPHTKGRYVHNNLWVFNLTPCLTFRKQNYKTYEEASTEVVRFERIKV